VLKLAVYPFDMEKELERTLCNYLQFFWFGGIDYFSGEIFDRASHTI
jgi:hypothetical protein